MPFHMFQDEEVCRQFEFHEQSFLSVMSVILTRLQKLSDDLSEHGNTLNKQVSTAIYQQNKT